MATALTPLANITLGSAAATVTFSSISGSYRDLLIVCNSIGTAAANMTINYNGDSGANYTYLQMNGDGNATTSTGANSQVRANIGRLSTSLGINIVQIMDYSATTLQKTSINRASLSDAMAQESCSRWASTAAINSFVLTAFGTTFAAGSSFALYGVSA